MMNIEEAIQQRQFRSVYHKMVLNILFTASWLEERNSKVLRPYGVSNQQYNILRILRGLHPNTATVKLLTERMLDKMSNASRLVEKLKQKGLVERNECPNDRRRVDVSITPAGLKLLSQTDSLMNEAMDAQFYTLSPEQAAQLSDLLDRLRSTAAPTPS